MRISPVILQTIYNPPFHYFMTAGLNMPHMTRGGCKLYQVVGRKAPTEDVPEPPAFRMKLFAPNEVIAKSRFWYFLHQYRNMKKTHGEILDINEIRETDPLTVKNYGIWLRYDSRTGTHNMYREYRSLTLNDAVNAMYSEMAGRHRARPRSIQIIKTGILASADVKRENLLQVTLYFSRERCSLPFYRLKLYINLPLFVRIVSQYIELDGEKNPRDVKFPLPHRIQRAPTKSLRTTFKAIRPNTHFN
mmetsp:Transcript_23393/g.46519  ORF Transcript_23393/g.46519 Transcript_23393/m.46519 type:complete len:247 (+) Transcript_23393:105-845(+)